MWPPHCLKDKREDPRSEDQEITKSCHDDAEDLAYLEVSFSIP
jgi:hypothetical protein